MAEVNVFINWAWCSPFILPSVRQNTVLSNVCGKFYFVWTLVSLCWISYASQCCGINCGYTVHADAESYFNQKDSSFLFFSFHFRCVVFSWLYVALCKRACVWSRWPVLHFVSKIPQPPPLYVRQCHGTWMLVPHVSTINVMGEISWNLCHVKRMKFFNPCSCFFFNFILLSSVCPYFC